MAVDTSTGSVYVVTGGSSFSGGEKVEKFDASGNPSNFSFLGTNSFTACEFGCIRGIAVDNSAGVDHGVIYLAMSQGNILVYRASGQFVQSYRYSHVIREKFSSDGNYCGVAVDSSGNLYIQHDSGFFENGSFTDKFHPGRWKINPNPPQIWPVAGVFQQPEDGGTCKISSDANQFLYTAQGSIHGHGHSQTLADVGGGPGRAPVEDDRHRRHVLLRRIRPPPTSTRTRARRSPASTPKGNRSRSSAKAT